MHFRVLPPLQQIIPTISCRTSLPPYLNPLFLSYFTSCCICEAIYLHICLFIHSTRFTFVFLLSCNPLFPLSVALKAFLWVSSPSPIPICSGFPFDRLSIYIYKLLSLFLLSSSQKAAKSSIPILRNPLPPRPLSNYFVTLRRSACVQTSCLIKCALRIAGGSLDRSMWPFQEYVSSYLSFFLCFPFYLHWSCIETKMHKGPE